MKKANFDKKPRDAGSLILYKITDNQIYILMGRRPPSQKFMPDIFVFPGGAVEREDGYMEFTEDLNIQTKKILTKYCSIHRARAIALAAIRETYEETGIMIGEKEQKFSKKFKNSWKVFEENKIKPRLDTLKFIARAITPKGQTKRFHARFFLSDSKFKNGFIKYNNELLDIDWYPLNSIFSTLPLAQVTELILKEAITKLNLESHHYEKVPVFSRRRGKRVVRYDLFNSEK
tara:strand:- start:1063 stop:1758 length:696 start_codon:yes stop_codon:yes gene_type:complete